MTYRRQEHVERDLLHARGVEQLDEPERLFGREAVLTTGSGDLVVELLQDLHREGQVFAVQQVLCGAALARLLGRRARRVDQDVRVNEPHGGS